MRALHACLLLIGGWTLLSACADLIGIADLPDASDASLPPTDGAAGNLVCPGSTSVIITTDSLYDLDAAGGYVYAKSPNGLVRCPASGGCSVPPNILSLDPNFFFESYTVDSLIYYTMQGNTNQGSIHSAALDGTNDQVVLGNLGSPTDIATSGTRILWLDDTNQPSAHCIGCTGNDASWMSGFRSYGRLWADSSNVYVMTSDGGSSGTTDGIYGCHLSSACGTSYRTVVTGLDFNDLPGGGDGTNVYVWRYEFEDIISVDPSGVIKPLVGAIDAVDLKVDSATHELFFATSGGEVARIPTGGGSAVALTTCNGSFGNITSIAIDATNVYILIELTSSNRAVYALPR